MCHKDSANSRRRQTRHRTITLSLPHRLRSLGPSTTASTLDVPARPVQTPTVLGAVHWQGLGWALLYKPVPAALTLSTTIGRCTGFSKLSACTVPS
ncbi:hypothetical protein EXIGLDRAFT_470125 [Exidia glandulosa HHB12029]|uniref:Uncharacterized protein n=1 Tax=Exidia glandulosa HHB12029 TaxID=1314781 RepID=A0A165JYD8_EXIGL|nr:hypothetical protein EXIGLDRAFT_470125 [Exidia glandulosa HHB12029]